LGLPNVSFVSVLHSLPRRKHKDFFGRMKLKLRIIGDPILAAKAKPVTEIDDELIDISQDMIQIMHHSHGVGLAGNQVGLLKRIVVIDFDAPTDDDGNPLPLETPGEKQLIPLMPITLINPEIISYSEEKCGFEEGCLSVPKIYANVVRSSRVVLRTQLLNGPTVLAECGGFLARVLQHEIDHLDGNIYLQRVSDEDMKPVQSQVAKLLRKSAPRNFKIRKLV